MKLFQRRVLGEFLKDLILFILTFADPSNLNQIENRRYFITFSDDFSRETWVSFMPEKSSAFDIFKKFKIVIKKSLEIPYAS